MLDCRTDSLSCLHPHKGLKFLFLWPCTPCPLLELWWVPSCALMIFWPPVGLPPTCCHLSASFQSAAEGHSPGFQTQLQTFFLPSPQQVVSLIPHTECYWMQTAGNEDLTFLSTHFRSTLLSSHGHLLWSGRA